MPQSRLALAVILAALWVGGCRQPHVMTQVDYVACNAISGADDSSSHLDAAIAAAAPPPTVQEPGSPLDWELSLEEALRLGLENNRLIRLLGYLPAEAGTDIEAALAQFDPFFEVGSAWRQLREPQTTRLFVPPQIELFGGAAGYGTNATAGGPTQFGFSSSPGGETIALAKRNATGGLTSLSLSTDYINRVPGSPLDLFDPLWSTRLTFALEQPLLQGAGVEFNRSLILIARAGHDQAAHEFEAAVRNLLRDVERAYWDLHFAYHNLYSREVGMQLALAVWQSEKARLEEGAGSRPDVAQAREQYESFRDARVQALDFVLVAEANLRELLGLPPQDGRRLVPADDPLTAEFLPHWEAAVFGALELRPELAARRLAIRAAEIELERQKNGLLPDLTAIAAYSGLGADDDLAGSLGRIGSRNFEDWTLGIRMRVPLGERAAHAAVRRAELALSRERAALQNLEQTVVFELRRAYQALRTQYESLHVRQARRQAAREFLDSQIEVFREGRTTIFVLLQAQARYSDALRDEALAATQYNQALIDWEFARGTIAAHDNVALVAVETQPVNLELWQRRVQRAERAIPIPLPTGDRVHWNDYPCTDPWAGCVEPLYTPERFHGFGTLQPAATPRSQ